MSRSVRNLLNAHHLPCHLDIQHVEYAMDALKNRIVAVVKVSVFESNGFSQKLRSEFSPTPNFS